MSLTSLEKNNSGKARFRGCSNIRDYEFLGKLGEGTFGEVYKARSKRDNSVVALKKILMHHEKEGFPITAVREIKILKMLSHPNVLVLKEMAVERSKGDGLKKPSMYMSTPYMEHDLAGLLENPAVQFTEPQIKCYLMQLLEGLRYLHGNGGILQIADFGLARPFDEPPPQPGKGEEKQGVTIDMWGVGCVFGEMFKGKPILSGTSDLNQAHLIFGLVGTPDEENMPGCSTLPGCEGVKNFGYRRGNLAEVFKDIQQPEPYCYSLLTELLKLDWRKRINAIDALKHPYFATPPLPARPGEIPYMQDSHELDRKRLRGQRAPLPPAPPGGSVDAPSNGGWSSSGPRSHSAMNRIPNGARGSRSNAPGASNNYRRGLHPTNRDSGLPPRPPISTHQNWEEDQRRDRYNQGRQNDRHPKNSVDSYIPRYGGPQQDRPRDLAEHNVQQNPDWRGANRRDYRRDQPPRRRSRSPGFRDTSRG
ncbi:hypothetical protein N7470_000707 [Penicillium chermesinum]|nr:hypothetical protein N7470_000707 [Penicillium chermesinum]